MALTSSQTVDLSQVLASVLAEVDGLRTYWYVADTVRPNACVIGQPDIDYGDQLSGMCSATWTFPLTLITTRSDDRQAQLTMSRLLADVTAAIGAADVAGVLEMTPVDARPQPGVTVQGQELPAYLL